MKKIEPFKMIESSRGIIFCAGSQRKFSLNRYVMKGRNESWGCRDTAIEVEASPSIKTEK